MFGENAPLTQSRYNYRWVLYCKSAGIASSYIHKEKIPVTQYRHKRTVERMIWKPDIAAHQFKHLYARILFEAGIPDLAAQRFLDHADIYTTKKIYQHFRENTMPIYAKQLNAYLSKTAQKANKDLMKI